MRFNRNQVDFGTTQLWGLQFTISNLFVSVKVLFLVLELCILQVSKDGEEGAAGGGGREIRNLHGRLRPRYRRFLEQGFC